MASYDDLRNEPPPGGTAWRAQLTPPNMTTYLLDPLRVKYGMGPELIGAAGDNNHLSGRHRSRDWDLTSDYCTNPAYGTTDARDRRGDGRWYRGFDVGIKGQLLFDASHRMDELTRSGRCPGIAEWFGTFDGSTVVGWFEGHPSSSDDSHLSHLHGGVWTESANDIPTMQMIYTAISGDAPKGADDMLIFAIDKTTGRVYRCNGITCIPVPDDQVLNQTYVYGGGTEWTAISSKANAVGPYFKTAVQVEGAAAGVKSHLAVYDMGFFGEVAGGESGLSYDQTVQAARDGAELAEDS